MLKLLILVSLLFMTEQVRGDVSRAKAETELRKSLLTGYDPHALPNEKTILNFTGLEVLNIYVKEADHAVTIYGWLKYSWEDPRLTWNVAEHDNISMLGVLPERVWTPDLTVYSTNNALKIKPEPDEGIYIVLYNTGKLLFVPGLMLHSSCLMDLTYWPHDVHNCTVKMGSWIRSGYKLDIDLSEFEFEFSNGKTLRSPDNKNVTGFPGTEWIISDTSVFREVKYYDCCTEPYVDMQISMILTRDAPAFTWTIKLPVACLCLMTLVLFLLPPDAGEKVIFGGVCLILDFLYINYTSSAVNNAPSHTPLIVKLVGQQIVMALVSVFLSAIVVRMARSPHTYGLPIFIKGSVFTLGRFLCLGNYANFKSSAQNSVKESEAELGNESSSDTAKQKENINEWILLAAVVDRLAFFLYFAICTIILIRFSSIL